MLEHNAQWHVFFQPRYQQFLVVHYKVSQNIRVLYGNRGPRYSNEHQVFLNKVKIHLPEFLIIDQQVFVCFRRKFHVSIFHPFMF